MAGAVQLKTLLRTKEEKKKGLRMPHLCLGEGTKYEVAVTEYKDRNNNHLHR